MARRQVSDVQREYIHDALKAGVSNREVARSLGISPGTVSAIRNQGGIIPKGQKATYTRNTQITRSILDHVRDTIGGRNKHKWNEWSLIDEKGAFPPDIAQQIRAVNTQLGLEKDARAGYAVAYRAQVGLTTIQDAIIDLTSQTDWREFYAN